MLQNRQRELGDARVRLAHERTNAHGADHQPRRESALARTRAMRRRVRSRCQGLQCDAAAHDYICWFHSSRDCCSCSGYETLILSSITSHPASIEQKSS